MNLPAMIPLRVLAEEVDVVADEAAIWGMDDLAYPGVRFVLQVRNALLPLTPERIRVIRDYCDLLLEEEESSLRWHAVGCAVNPRNGKGCDCRSVPA